MPPALAMSGKKCIFAASKERKSNPGVTLENIENHEKDSIPLHRPRMDDDRLHDGTTSLQNRGVGYKL